MQKKLQVFVSSTYIDLKEERQAAVEAILSMHHIPAGMELFSAGDASQLDAIKRWIDESDIYLLILGGRYGTIEPKSGKSYTHLEYEYAVENEKPYFAIVMTDAAIKEKIKTNGMDVFEYNNYNKFEEFKKIVQSRMCEYFTDNKDIKIAILKALNDCEKKYGSKLIGWVSGREVENYKKQEKLFNANLTPTTHEMSNMQKLKPASVKYTIMSNGKKIIPDVMFKEGMELLLPIRAIAESINVHVSWSSEKKEVIFSSQDKKKELTVGIENNKCTLNGENLNISLNQQIINNRTVVSAKKVIELLGGNITINYDNQIIEIYY